MNPLQLSWGNRNSSHKIAGRIHDAAASAGLELDHGQRRLVQAMATAASDALSRRAAARPDNHYIYGPPGRGKSWVLGLLHDAVQSEGTRRMHFHDFFRELHARTHGVEQVDTGGTSPIDQALDDMLGPTRVLCFDELHVHDPGDAMFFARTLKAIFARRILLIATSNYAPEDLLSNEYFHHLFEPTIEMITRGMSVTRLDAGTDYRTLATTPPHEHGYAAGHVLVPGSAGQLRAAGLTVPASHELTDVTPTTHTFPALRAAQGQAWFDFRALCDAPSAASDYLYLAEHFDHVVIDGIPAPDRAGPSAWKRLANLIDVLYDRDIRTDLICMAAPDPTAAGGHAVDAARLASRLAALQTPDNAPAPHDEPTATIHPDR
ncbi:cell division protein ZapE [Arthrobacter sp. JSM 101049]|uniref:cell division protein ZapE n=1 Tax=Arthrobacter sp. JSM 101049 TaxID=929097 RepID=UPI00356871C3